MSLTERLPKVSPIERGAYYNHAMFRLMPDSPYDLFILHRDCGSRILPRLHDGELLLPYGGSAFLQLLAPTASHDTPEEYHAFLGLQYMKARGELLPVIHGSLGSRQRVPESGHGFQYTTERGLDFHLEPVEDTGKSEGDDASRILRFRRPGYPEIQLSYRFTFQRLGSS